LNTRFIDIIRSSPNPRIIVVGDVILDTYILGKANRISPEAPIQVLDVGGERCNLGGAANVAANLKTLGADVECCGVVGADRDGDAVVEKLTELGIGTSGVVRDEGRPTVSKTRVVSHNQQLLRIDREVRLPLDDAAAARLMKAMKPHLADSAAVAVSDYAKGTLTPALLRGVMEAAGNAGCDSIGRDGIGRDGIGRDGVRCCGVLVDPKGTDYGKYRGARLITPNRKEAEESTGVSIGGMDDLEEAARILRRDAGAREIVITLGGDGIYFSDAEGRGSLVPARARSVYDVTGAGDTVIALLAFFLASGSSLEEAVRIANAGAGIVVGRLGVAAPTREELVDAFSSVATRSGEKILPRGEAALRTREIRERGEKLVFTNGCFDLIHGGHLEFLRAAKSLGDHLMVAVNDDASVARIKGPERPILALEERMEILASLQFVDYVVSFSEDTPLEIVREVTPDILVKGEDWKEKGVVGAEWVQEHGGDVQLVKLRSGRSTTDIIKKILEKYGAGGS